MIGKDRFRTNYPAIPLAPNGRTLNLIGNVLNETHLGTAHGRGYAGQHVDQAALRIGVAEITDATQSAAHFYIAKFRYFDGTDKKWQAIETEVFLDAAAYRRRVDQNDQPIASGISGVIPKYKKGDLVPAYYDAQAIICVPLQSPPAPPTTAQCFSFEKVVVPRATDQNSLVSHNNSASIVLEKRLSETNEWSVLLPDLVMKPTGRHDGVTGSIPILVRLKHHESLRLRCGTAKYSRAVMQVTISGMSIKWLGRISGETTDPDDETNGSEHTVEASNTDGYQNIPMELQGQSSGLFIGEPELSIDGEGNDAVVRVRMSGDASQEWLAEVTIWAGIIQDNVLGLIKAFQQPSDTPSLPYPGSTSDKALVEGDFEENLIPGVMQRFASGGTFEDIDMRCWILFCDRYVQFDNIQEDFEYSIAEVGKVYGPCEYAGIGTVNDLTLPVYSCMLGEQKYYGRSTNIAGVAAKGNVEQFILFDGNERETSIQRKAKLKFNKHDRRKVAVIERVNGLWLAGTAECASS